jgi:hypothetical protein
MHDWSIFEWLWATLSILGAGLMYATQVGPKQAVSHAAEWAFTFGVKNPPDWLKSQDADRVLRHVGWLLLVVCLLAWSAQYFDVGSMPLKTKSLFWLCALGTVAAIGLNLSGLDGKLSLQPSHFMFVGLLIALAGIVWQWRSPPANPQVGALRAQLEALEKKLAEANEPGRPQTRLATVGNEPAPKPTFTAYDIGERQKALDEIYRFFNKEVYSIYMEAAALLPNWEKEVRERGPRGYAENLTTYRNRHEAMVQAYEQLFKPYEGITDMRQLRGDLGSVGTAQTDAFIKRLRSLPDRVAPEVVDAMKDGHLVKNLLYEYEVLQNWQPKSKELIRRRRDEWTALASKVDGPRRVDEPKPVAVAAPAPPPRQLSAYEAELKVRAIDKVLRVLSTDMQAVIDKFPAQQNWWNALKDPKNHPNFRPGLLVFRDEFKTASLKLDALRNELPEYQDLIGMVQQTYYEKVLKAVERYLIQFMYVQDTVKPDASAEALKAFMDDAMTGQYEAMNEFIRWRNGAREQVLQLRRQISP